VSLPSDAPTAPGGDVEAPPWLVASVRRMGLARPDQQVRAAPMTGGVSSDVYAVSAGDRRCCVKRPLETLRVAAEWRAPLERGDREEAWLRFAGRIVPDVVPRVLASDAEHHVFAMEFLEPAAFASWKALLMAGHAQPGVATVLGRALAALHRASAETPEAMARFADQSIFGALRVDPYFGAVARAHPALREALDEITAQVLAPRAVIHGDVSPKNILVGDRRVVLLDAECASVGDPAFDLAFCLTHLTLKAVYRPNWRGSYEDLARELISAYVEDLPAGGAADLAGRVARQMGGLLLARVDGKSPVEYLPEDARDVVRGAAIEVLRRPSPAPLDVFARVAGGLRR
jgi:5-methylthioribose kinase